MTVVELFGRDPNVKEPVGSRMQRAAEARLDEVYEAHDRIEEDPEDEQAMEVAGMFCGCSTCTVREILDAAIPILLDAIRAGEVEL